MTLKNSKKKTKKKAKKKIRKASNGASPSGKFKLSPQMHALLQANAKRLGWTVSRLIDYALRRAFSDVERLEAVHATYFVNSLIRKRLGTGMNKKMEVIERRLKKITIGESQLEEFSRSRSLEIEPADEKPCRDFDTKKIWALNLQDELELWLDQHRPTSGYHVGEPKDEPRRVRSLLNQALKRAKSQLLETGYLLDDYEPVNLRSLISSGIMQLERKRRSPAESEALRKEYAKRFEKPEDFDRSKPRS